MNDVAEPIKVFSYIRESTEDQLYNGYRPGYQRRAIGRYCERHNFVIEEEFIDGQSGTKVDRTHFSEMIEKVKKRNDIRFIVVEEVSRFSRDYLHCLNIEATLQKESNVFVIDTIIDNNPRAYLTGKIDPNIAESRRSSRSRAQYESELTSTRRTQQNEEKRMDHSHPGQLPYAIKWCPKQGKKLLVEYDEAKTEIVKVIFNIYLSHPGMGFQAIANELNAKGYIYTKLEKKYNEADNTLKTVEKAQPFSKDFVRGILTSTAYIGLQNFQPCLPYKTLVNGEKKNLEPLISKHDWDLAQLQIDKNTKGTSSKIKRSSRQRPERTYLLQGIGYSAANGSKLHAQTETPHGRAEVRRYVPARNRTKDDQVVGTFRADEVEDRLLSFLRYTKINDLETIENSLHSLIVQDVNAKRSRVKTQSVAWEKSAVKANEDMIKHLKQMIEADPSSHSTIYPTLEICLKKKRDMETASFNPYVDYYDFEDIADFAKNTYESVKKLQSLAAQQQVVQIMFDEVMIHKISAHSRELIEKEGQFLPLEQAKELKALLQEYCPKLFERVYLEKREGEVKLSIEPSGLLILLADPDVTQYTDSGSDFLKNVVDGAEPKKKTLLSY